MINIAKNPEVINRHIKNLLEEYQYITLYYAKGSGDDEIHYLQGDGVCLQELIFIHYVLGKMIDSAYYEEE